MTIIIDKNNLVELKFFMNFIHKEISKRFKWCEENSLKKKIINKL